MMLNILLQHGRILLICTYLYIYLRESILLFTFYIFLKRGQGHVFLGFLMYTLFANVSTQKSKEIANSILNLFKYILWYSETMKQGCEGQEVMFPQIYKGDPRPRILPHLMALSAMELKLGVFLVFCQPPYTKTNAKQMCCSVLRMFIFTLRPQKMQVTYAPDKPWLFWLRENLKTPNLSPMPGWKWCRFWDLPCISVYIPQMHKIGAKYILFYQVHPHLGFRFQNPWTLGLNTLRVHLVLKNLKI